MQSTLRQNSIYGSKSRIDEKEYCTLKKGSCFGVLYCDEKRVDVHFQSQTAWNVTLYRNKGSRWSSKRWKRVPSRLNWQRIKQKMVLDNRGACLDNDDFCICFQNSFEESYFYTFTGEVLFLCKNLFRFLFWLFYVTIISYYNITFYTPF